MKARILIVEDEELTARAMAFAFEREGTETEIAADGETAIRAARERPPDAILLDVTLPGPLDGFDICRLLRDETTAPILVVSARGTETDRVLGLERGADDYVTKPFSMAELIARVRAQLRRVELDRRSDSVRVVGDIAVDLEKREVEVEGRRRMLTTTEFKLLALLAERAGGVVSRDELMSELWARPFSGQSRACDAHIRRLRSKIERDPRRPRHLLTVRGVGYKLAA